MNPPSRFLAAAVALCTLALPSRLTLAQRPRLVSGPESPLSAPAVLDRAPDRQFPKALVPTSEGWIALWSDEIVRYADIRLLATRLRADGSVVDPTGLRVADHFNFQYQAYAAVPDPAGVRIYWAPPAASHSLLHTLTIDDRGERSESVIVGEFPSESPALSLSVAVSGSRTAVLLHRYVMILENARPVRTVDVGGWGEWGRASIVAAGNHFVLMWVAAGGVLMQQTLDFDGNAVGPAGGIGVAAAVASFALATDGAHVLLVWRNVTAAGQFGDTISISIIDPGRGALTKTDRIEAVGGPAQVVWTGSSYLVSWSSAERDAIVGIHVSTTGAILDDEPVQLAARRHDDYVIGAQDGNLAMIFSSETCAWPCLDEDVYATTLPDGGATNAALISRAARPQYKGAIASDGARFLALWWENDEIFATETTAGSRAPSAPIALPPVLAPYPDSVALSSDGSGYFVVWAEHRSPQSTRLMGAVFSRAGDALSPQPLVIDIGPIDPRETPISIGASKGMYLVVSEFEGSLDGVRVLSDGTLVDTIPIALGSNLSDRGLGMTAFDGEDFIVTARSVTGEVGDPGTVENLITMRVSVSGIARFDRTWTTGPFPSVHGVSLACSSDGVCLMTWSQETPHGFRLSGQRIRRGGTLIDSMPFVIDESEFVQHGLLVAWNGARFVVTWSKDAGDFSNKRFEARTIETASLVEQSLPDLLLTFKGWLSYTPAAACNHEEQCMVVYGESVDDSKLGRTSRLFKRFFGHPRQRSVRR